MLHFATMRTGVLELYVREKNLCFLNEQQFQKNRIEIEQELKDLRTKKKMDIDLFYRDPYVLDF